MRSRKYIETVTFKLTKEQRAAIETLADQNETSIGEAARELVNAGILHRRQNAL